MNFKPGQRVKRIGGAEQCSYDIVPPGQCGVILHYGRFLDGSHIWEVKFDSGLVWSCVAESLTPLLPPEETAWADEAVKRVTRPQHIEPVKTKESA